MQSNAEFQKALIFVVATSRWLRGGPYAEGAQKGKVPNIDPNIP